MTVLQKRITYLVILIPVITFFAFFFRYTVNAPINDDYSILNFINQCIATDSIAEKLKLMFAQHNEHRIFYDRLWTIISYKLQRNVNFNTLALVGNLSLLGIAAIFFRKFLLSGKNALLFLPVTVFIFNLSQWENMTFAMSGMSNFTVYLFMLISLNFLTREAVVTTKSTLLSVLFFLLAVLTQGGGLFLFPVSILIFLYKKDYKNLLVYGILSALIAAAYFYGYQKPPQSGTISGAFGNIIGVMQFACAFLGNAFNYFLIYSSSKTSIIVTQIIGSLFLVLFGYITIKKYYKQNLFVYSIMLLIVISAFVTAISRVSLGLEVSAASRYRINGIIFFIALYFWMLDTFNVEKKLPFISIISLSGLYFLFINLNQYEYLSIRERQTYTGILFSNSGHPNLLNCDRSDMGFYTRVIEESKALDTYHFPEANTYFPKAKKHLVNVDSTTETTLYYSIDTMEQLSGSYLIEGYAFMENQWTKNQKVYIGLKSKEECAPTYYLARQISRFDLNPFYKKISLKDAGFSVRIPSENIKFGEYDISVVVVLNDDIKIMETDKKIKKQL
jgi:hypothetical protein